MPAKNNTPRTLTFRGRTQTLDAWAAELRVAAPTLRARLDRLGWSVERALTSPAAAKFGRSSGRPAKGSPRSAPKLKRHARGSAYVKWMEGGRRQTRYFGPWGSAKAREGYARFLREWAEGVAGDRAVPAAAGGRGTVAELVARWLDHARERYVKFGRQTSEYHCHRAACGVLLDRCPLVPLSAFGLEDLEAVRADMVARNWTRKTVNKHVARIVLAFGWGVPRRLIPADVHYALQQIEPLAAGATRAPEQTPVRSVPAEHVAAVLADSHLHPDAGRRAVLAAMIRVQLLTGMRPGELVAMRPEHLDRSGSEWKYAVPDAANKNFHREQPRPVWLGPRAQALLGPLVKAAERGGHTVFAFEPQRRKSLGPRPVARTEYARLVKLACARAKVPEWHPHRLRHNKATDVKKLYESDAAAARAIGTSEDVAARIYADPQESVDRRIARATG